MSNKINNRQWKKTLEMIKYHLLKSYIYVNATCHIASTIVFKLALCHIPDGPILLHTRHIELINHFRENEDVENYYYALWNKLHLYNSITFVFITFVILLCFDLYASLIFGALIEMCHMQSKLNKSGSMMGCILLNEFSRPLLRIRLHWSQTLIVDALVLPCHISKCLYTR